MAEKLATHMSSYQHDVAPDLLSVPECSADAKEALLGQCDNIWGQMNKCQSRLNELGSETLPGVDAQLYLLMMQVKSLTAECNQWQKRAPEILSTDQDVLLALGKVELQKVHQELEMVLSSVRSKNKKLKEELKTEQRWLEEQQQLVQALSSRQQELKSNVMHFSEKRVGQDIEENILKVRSYEQELLKALGEFLEDHFPLPEESGRSDNRKKSLMNKMLSTPHEPYLSIDESHWPPYIELLLRYGIALRHPTDPNRIRLESFHL
ncbi:centromere protein K isoform X2 [Ambystoma mexicanum]|uniref:centromere protein K isoform X2 n=1 Tax=Ambystoma mexicanum TaxID=8296 RepID=UPI0037E964D7